MQPDNNHAPAARSDGPHDGRPALSDRVRSLRLGDRPAAGRGGSRGSFIPWAACAVLLLTTLVFGVKAFRAPPAPDADPESTAKPGQSLASSSAAPTGDVLLESRGYVIAAHSIQLSPQVGGEIVWLDPDFREGAVYKKGATLAEIDPVIYKAQLKSAMAAREVAKTNLWQVENDNGSTRKEIEAMEAQVKNLAARLEMSQLDESFNRAAGSGASRSDLEKSIIQVKIDQAGLESQRRTLAKLKAAQKEQLLVCKAQLQRAEADVEQATKQLKNCTMTAPTTGIILSKKAELHGYVNPLAFGATGYLCEMADLADLEVDLSIQERDIDKVLDSEDCVVRPEAFANSATFKKKHPDGYSGRISRVMPIADRSKGAISVRVAIDREQIPEKEVGLYLKPDMSVLVWFKKAK
jgi:multidrug resistance efflux pump